MQVLFRVLTLLAFLLTPHFPTFAGEYTDLSLIAEGDTFAPGETVWVAARLDMDEGWHTYWEFSGEAGMETTLNWTLPDGFEAGEIHWPAPYRFLEAETIVTFGYKDVVHLLVPIHTPANIEPGTEVTFSLHAAWLECEEICLPGEGEDTLTLTAGDAPEPHPVFEEVRRSIPRDLEGWSVSWSRDNDHLLLTVTPPESHLPPEGNLSFFPKNERLWNLLADFDISRENQTLRIRGKLAERPELPDTLQGILVHESGLEEPGGPRVLRIRAAADDPAPSPGLPGLEREARGLFGALLGALVAGVMLNLTPCVFPVLGLKISSFVEQAHGDRKATETHALVFAAGILISLWILGAIVAALGAAWGAQFQDPRVVILLLLALTLFTMNLFGIFEWGASLTSLGGGLTQKQGYAGSFFQGVLMTLVATPCTGPFLAPLIGWMLVQPLWVGFLAFTAMGVGISLPYVVLAFNPKLMDKLPAPGNWMITFKQACAFILLLFLWLLLYVLNTLVSGQVTMQVLGAMMLVGFAAWVYGTWGEPTRKPRVRHTAKALTLLILLLAGILGLGYSTPATELTDDLAERIDAGEPIRYSELSPDLAEQLVKDGVPVQYRPFSHEKFQNLRDQGQAVFVDFTAEWCTICQVNKFTTLHRREVMRAFQDHNVVTLRADYTAHDPAIAEFLARYERRGVPVYLYYPHGENAQPLLLPEKLSPEIIHDTLDKQEP